MLVHESGEYISGYATIPITKIDPHGATAGISYLRRTSLAAIIGLLQVDDDGNSAIKESTVVKKGKATKTTQEEIFEELSDTLKMDASKCASSIVDLFEARSFDKALDLVFDVSNDFKVAVAYEKCRWDIPHVESIVNRRDSLVRFHMFRVSWFGNGQCMETFMGYLLDLGRSVTALCWSPFVMRQRSNTHVCLRNAVSSTVRKCKVTARYFRRTWPAYDLARRNREARQ
jgi:hypothetical protein